MESPPGPILIGIDEAGYGPILGPLVVSAAAFEVVTPRADRCLWRTLARAVSPTVESRDPRLPILDSKKLYQRKEGLARLEKSVLAVTTAWRETPPTLRRFLGLLCPETLGDLDAYPWYRDADADLPRSADLGAVRIAAGLLKREMSAQSVRPAGVFAEIMLEGHYNRLVGRTRNKAVLLLGMVLRLIHRITELYPRHELRIFADKQGARSHYGPALMRAFEDRRLKVIAEDDNESAYELLTGSSRWCVRFSQSGETKHLPVALASLIAKYSRELLMERFNDFWRRQAPDVKSTAGYYQDGLRFLREVEPHAQRLGIERRWLVRQR